MDYDVIIVGAGPAGSAAAIPLAQAGQKVLIVDSSEFPREKPCGDAILPGAVQILEELGVLPEINAAQFPSISRLVISSPNGTKVNLSVEPINPGNRFIMAERASFDHVLLRKAMDLGAEFRRGRVTELLQTSKAVSGIRFRAGNKELQISAHYIVGADGSTSIVRRSLMESQPPTHSVAIRAYAEPFHCDANTVEFHFIDEVFPGYAWIFPLGPDRANIGLGIDLDDYNIGQDHLNSALNRFLAKPEIRERFSSDTQISSPKAGSYWFTAVDPGPYAFPGALLTGDAAGFMDPLSGEGIRNALLSGKLAGEAISDALKKDWSPVRTVTLYSHSCEREILPRLNRSMALRRRFLKSPSGFDRWLKFFRIVYPFARPLLNTVSTNFRFH